MALGDFRGFGSDGLLDAPHPKEANWPPQCRWTLSGLTENDGAFAQVAMECAALSAALRPAREPSQKPPCFGGAKSPSSLRLQNEKARPPTAPCFQIPSRHFN